MFLAPACQAERGESVAPDVDCGVHRTEVQDDPEVQVTVKCRDCRPELKCSDCRPKLECGDCHPKLKCSDRLETK